MENTYVATDHMTSHEQCDVLHQYSLQLSVEDRMPCDLCSEVPEQLYYLSRSRPPAFVVDGHFRCSQMVCVNCLSRAQAGMSQPSQWEDDPWHP